MRRAGWIAALIGLPLIAILLATAWFEPAASALACPRCYGFEPLPSHIYVDPAMPADRRAQLQNDVSAARARVTAFYGGTELDPVILACWTEACQRRLKAGSARAVTYAAYGLRLSARSLDTVFIAHELSHIELHGRLGLRAFAFGDMPAWFDERVAVVVSDDPRYLRSPETPGSRCLAAADGDLLAQWRAWGHAAGDAASIYARAARRVLTWMDGHGGPPAVRQLIRRMAAGERFATLYQASE